MNHVIVYADGGVWYYRTLDGNGDLIADGAEEGYDSYDTVIEAVTREFPGALIATKPVEQSPVDAENPAVVDEVPTDGALR